MRFFLFSASFFSIFPCTAAGSVAVVESRFNYGPPAAAAGRRPPPVSLLVASKFPSRKIDVFAYPRGGRNTCFFLERHVSDLPPQGEISTCVREIGAAAAAYSPLPSSFFFPAFGWHGRTGSLPEDNTQVGELARFK